MNKKYLLFLVCITAILSIISITELSYAQTQFSTKQLLSEDKVFIYVQTIVKNSEGQVLTYLTSHEFTNLDLDALEILLNSEASENDPVITVDGKKFQVLKRQTDVTYGKEDVIASTLLAHATDNKLNIVARFAHDGYPILVGEEVTSIWTFIRPVH